MIQARAVVVEEAGSDPVCADIDVADLEADEVLVRVAATGVCHTDLSVASGVLPFQFPVVLGHEAAGVVEAVGPAVARVRPGDHVVASIVHHCGHCRFCETGHSALCVERGQSRPRYSRNGTAVAQAFGTGTFSEVVVLRERSVCVVPDSVPLPVAAVTGCAVITGVGAVLNVAEVRPGATVAVFGCGGVGASIIMGAHLAGAERIVAVEPNRKRHALARELGATSVLLPDEESLTSAAPSGFDYTFESAGRVDAMELAITAAGRTGTVTLLGLPRRDARISVGVQDLVGGEKRILGCNMGRVRPAVDFDAYFRLYERGRLPLDKLVSTQVPLTNPVRAFELAKQGSPGRVLMTQDDAS